MPTPETAHAPLAVIDIAAEEHPKLLRYGIGEPPQWLAWAPARRNDNGWNQLLVSAKIAPTDLLPICQFSVEVEGEPPTLEAYFRAVAERIADTIQTQLTPFSSREPYVILNLAPLFLAATLLDKIVRGLFLSESTSLYRTRFHLIFVLRNVDWLVKSADFRKLVKEGQLPCVVSAVDLRGYGSMYLPGAPPTPFEVDRRAFFCVLPTQPERIYSSLVFETNSYIGHFALPHSHARTHYDLSEFVARDNVWEYVLSILTDLVGSSQSVFVLGTGTEHEAVRRLGDQFKSMMADRVPVSVRYVAGTASLPGLVASWSEGFELALVLSDIVNTGGTLATAIRALRTANLHNRPIRVFTVARMKNSPTNIDGVSLATAVPIRRDFYSKLAAECPLCELKQPLVEVKSASDFAHVDPHQLTPLDFWELVKDSRALREQEQDPQSREFAYRVDTRPIVTRYSRWLENVVRHKAETIWPNTKPDLICTVNEDTGEAFARLVARALGVSTVKKISRGVLRRITPVGSPVNFTNPISAGTRVLLVDDGINYGNTMRGLITVSRVASATLMGAVVLDSRLDDRGVARLKHLMGGAPLLSLYTWPGPSPKL